MGEYHTCPYCTEDKDGFTSLLPRLGKGKVSIRSHSFNGPVLEISLPYKERLTVPIAFCPVCGRKLK